MQDYMFNFLSFLTEYHIYIIGFLALIILWLIFTLCKKILLIKKLRQANLQQGENLNNIYALYQQTKEALAEQTKEANKFYRLHQQMLKKESKREQNAKYFREQKQQEQELLEYQKSFEYKLYLTKNSKIDIKKGLMGTQEFMIYRELIFCKNITNNFIIFPQISLKSFVKNECQEDEVWKVYSNLVADFLFVIKDFKDKTTKPFAILEFNGSGHFGNSDEEKEKIKERDIIKKEVADKIGLQIYTIEGEAIYQKDKCYIDENLLKNEIEKLSNHLKEQLESKTC